MAMVRRAAKYLRMDARVQVLIKHLIREVEIPDRLLQPLSTANAACFMSLDFSVRTRNSLSPHPDLSPLR